MISKKILFLFFVVVSLGSLAQDNKLCPPSNEKKATNLVEEAKSVFKSKHDYDKLKELIDKAIEIDTGFAAPYIVLGDAAALKKDFKTMKEAYTHLLDICPDAGAIYHFKLADYLFETKKYEEAQKYFKSYLDFNSEDIQKNDEARQKVFRCKMYLHPVPFNPVPIHGISTADPEYLPGFSADGELCFFTRRYEMVSKNSITPVSVEKFMISRSDKGSWDNGEPMPPPFNFQNNNNEGGASISVDNNHLFFTVNKNGNFDIYSSDFIKGAWTVPQSIGDNVNDPKQWDSQPSISPDGKTLYFATFRDSVHMTSDLYKTTKGTDNKWTKPVRLSDKINTNGNEKSPFMHPDGKTLYFSSDSLPGMGGFDIFITKLDSTGKWTTPVNLGYPINTEADEVGFIVSLDGKSAYFASNKINGSTGYDIYSFELPKDVKPEKAKMLKVDVRDQNNEIPVAVKLELKNVATREVTHLDYDSTTGKSASVVLFDDDYIISVKKEGYAFNSVYFSKDDTTAGAVSKVDLNIKEIKVGESYKLNNIYFETNSFELKEASKEVIKDFSEFLRENPKVKVSIQGHTDNEGNPEQNLILSDNRAKSVYKFLIVTGIDAARLSYKGFGQTKPIADNATEEGKALNRRTEFLILSK